MFLKLFLFSGAMLFAQAIPPNPAYVLGPDSQPKPGVPAGKVSKFTWDQSRIFPGTSRSVSVYVPAQYDGSKPACLMIFQDGSGYAAVTGNGAHAPIVFDNLIADGSMPVTIAIFVDPGITPGATSEQMARYHRSLEYDGLGDKHARFLIEEIIPEVERRYNVKISTNPDDRGLAGGSSGGIASFVAAWERPDSFHRVISYIGSFTNLRGGDTLADMIRKVEPKPLRIFMQDGANDQSIYGGSWFQANQAVAASLEYAGYDVKFVIGTEGHSGRQGNSILPEALRWLWRDYPKPIEASKGGPGLRHYITDFLDPSSGWEAIGSGYSAATALAVDQSGTVFFADPKAAKIYRVSAGAAPAVFKDNVSATDLMFGPDGLLYAAEPARSRIVAYSATGAPRTVASNINARSLAVTSKSRIYFTDPAAKSISMLDAQGKPHILFHDASLTPASLRLQPDEHLIDVTDHDSRWVWSFEIAPDDTLRYGMAFHHLEIPDTSSVTESAGLTHDNTGHVYVATNLGIQISDPPGRVVGIIRKPGPGALTSVIFGDPALQTLYATDGDKLYRRAMRRTGAFPWQPVKLPRPQL